MQAILKGCPMVADIVNVEYAMDLRNNLRVELASRQNTPGLVFDSYAWKDETTDFLNSVRSVAKP